MKAIRQTEYGTDPEEVLRLSDVAEPTISDDEVLVRVHAASVDRGTWHIMTGRPYLIRAVGFWGCAQGADPAELRWTVVTCGKVMRAFVPGDDVYGTCDGSFAEYVRGRSTSSRNANLYDEAAACRPISGVTVFASGARQGESPGWADGVDRRRLGWRRRLRVQIAKAFGAAVTGVCSTAKVGVVRGLGAHYVIDYRVEDFSDGSSRYDVVLDVGGNSPLSHLRRAMTAQTGRSSSSAVKPMKRPEDSHRQLRALALSPFVSQSSARWHRRRTQPTSWRSRSCSRPARSPP